MDGGSLRTRTLDIAHNGAGGVVHEFDADLGNAAAGAGAAENARHLDELDGGFRGIHFGEGRSACGIEGFEVLWDGCCGTGAVISERARVGEVQMWSFLGGRK